MANTEVPSQFALKFLDIGPVVREPLSVEKVINTLQEPLPVSNIGPTDMEFVSKAGKATEDGKRLLPTGEGHCPWIPFVECGRECQMQLLHQGYHAAQLI